MFSMFDDFLLGKEIEYDGKTYLFVQTFSPKDELVLAVEKGAKLPAPVVIIKDTNKTKEKIDG